MEDIIKYRKILENANNKVSLIPDLYEDEDELYDDSEIISSFIDEEDLEREYTVNYMTPEVAKTLTTAKNDATVLETYYNHAEEEQKNIVNDKMKSWDDERIIVIMNKTVLDGNHHLVAGILSSRNIKYIDIAE